MKDMSIFDFFTEGDTIVVIFLSLTLLFSLIFTVVYCWSDTREIDDMDRDYRDEDGDHYYYDHTRISMKRNGRKV